jgi:hypothetical protein
MFQWSGTSWVERYNLPNPGNQDPPFKVTTRDFTGDGVLEFLVKFGESAPYGGLLSPVGQDCEWRWLDFVNVEGPSVQLVNNLRWSDQTGLLQGTEDNGTGFTIDFRYSFDPVGGKMQGALDPYSDPDLSWLADACDLERSLYPQLMDAADNNFDRYELMLDYKDGFGAEGLVDQWEAAAEDAVLALNTVGPSTLNLTSRDIAYLAYLDPPRKRYYSNAGSRNWWFIDYDGVVETHEQLEPYCSKLPPR